MSDLLVCQSILFPFCGLDRLPCVRKNRLKILKVEEVFYIKLIKWLSLVKIKYVCYANIKA